MMVISDELCVLVMIVERRLERHVEFLDLDCMNMNWNAEMNDYNFGDLLRFHKAHERGELISTWCLKPWIYRMDV